MDTAVRASAAKQVLSRCEYFRDRLRENPTGVAFLAQFSGCLALLRSVGHVLQKVDAVSSRTLGANQAKWWADLNASHSEPKIFWRFIEEDRNLILKESDIRAGQSVTVVLTGVEAPGLVAGEKPEPKAMLTKTMPEASYSYHMNRGDFTGRDPRDLIDEAIAWWHEQISKIEG